MTHTIAVVTAMRKILDRIYDGTIWLAALFMISILAAVLTSIVSRVSGFHVPGIDAYAGYTMAGAGFLALAHTLKRGEHIRVTLLIGKLKGTHRRFAEICVLSAGVLISGLLAWFSILHCLNSYEFNDISVSNDATPMWIPQTTMALGTLVFFIAFLDEWILEFRGQRASPQAEESHYE